MSAAFVNESLCGALQSLTMYYVEAQHTLETYVYRRKIRFNHARLWLAVLNIYRLDNMVFTGDRCAAID